ncbi:hypothetical protein QRE66_28175 (plasmid) [Bacillus cereus]|nr:hypothetical protein QRE66_28175 [Bacillus cereus]
MIKKIPFILLFILLLSACNDSMSESTEAIEKFKNAILTENLNELEDSLSPDKDMTIDSTYLKQMVSQYKKEPKTFDKLINLLYAQQSLLVKESNSVQSNELLRTQSPDQILNAGSFYLKKEKGLFSDNYVIGVRPHYIFVKASPDKAVIKIDKKKVYTTKTKGEVYKYGPVLPGIYQVEGERKYPYRTVTEKQEVNLLKESKISMSARVDLALAEVKDPRPLIEEVGKHAMILALEMYSEEPDVSRLSHLSGRDCKKREDGSITCGGILGLMVGKQLTHPITFKPGGTFYIGIEKTKNKSKDIYSLINSELDSDSLFIRIYIPKENIIQGITNLISLTLKRSDDTKELYYSSNGTLGQLKTLYANVEEARSVVKVDDDSEWFPVQVNSKSNVVFK